VVLVTKAKARQVFSEAKSKARPIFCLELFLKSRPILEDPIASFGND